MKAKIIFSCAVMTGLFMVVNIVKSMKESEHVVDMVLNHMESLATGEFTGDDMRVATSHICYFNSNYYDENSGTIVQKPVKGRMGICDGESGPCRSWSCTEVLQ